MRIIVLVTAAALALGCTKKVPTAAEGTAAPSEPSSVALAGGHAGAEAPGGAAMGSQAAPSVTGTVLETMDAAGYTYMKLKTAEGETWAAVNQSKVEKGATVTVTNPMPMDGFESKTLNRKFEHIVFGTLSTGAEAPAAMAAQHAAAARGPADVGDVKVDKAPGPDGRTVAQVFAEKAALKGKTVSVKGKVVKFNGGIMGRNWVHLRDGSGSAEKKDDDLTVTTSDAVAVGDVVTATGVVGVDKDFGAGYAYPLIIESAKVVK